METPVDKPVKPKRRYIKRNKPKPISETKDPNTKPINLVSFTFS